MQLHRHSVQAGAFALAPGQDYERPMGPGLLDCLPDMPGWVLSDGVMRSGLVGEPLHFGMVARELGPDERSSRAAVRPRRRA